MAATIEEIKQQTALIEAETARINAELARINAERAKEAASSPDNRLKDLQSSLALTNAQKDLSTAQTSARIAELFGDVKAGPFSGSVDMKEKAGTLEATLLATKAVREGGNAIAKKVKKSVETDVSGATALRAPTESDPKPARAVLIIPARSFDSFQRLLSYEFRKRLIGRALTSATPTTDSGDTEAVGAAPAVLSAGLDAVKNILGFFKTDFVVGGIDAKVEEAAAVFALAGALRNESTNVTVLLPGTFLPGGQQGAIKDISDDIKELADKRDSLVTTANQKSKDAEAAETQATTAQGAEKKRLTGLAAKLRAEALTATNAIALYDGFVASLITPDAAGNAPLAQLVNDRALNDWVKKGGVRVLLVRLESTGGGFLIKKNLWTGLGAAAPLYHMGGASLSYVLLDGPSGNVLSADVVAIHGGYQPSRKIREVLAQ